MVTWLVTIKWATSLPAITSLNMSKSVPFSFVVQATYYYITALTELSLTCNPLSNTLAVCFCDSTNVLRRMLETYHICCSFLSYRASERELLRRDQCLRNQPARPAAADPPCRRFY